MIKRKNNFKYENKKLKNMCTENIVPFGYNTFELFLEKEKSLVENNLQKKDKKSFKNAVSSKKNEKKQTESTSGNIEYLRKIENFENSHKSGLIGQDHAVKLVSSAFKRSLLNLNERKKPLGSFIFCGPTGVGKTELAKRLTLSLFGDLNRLVRFDMSEYMESNSISKLLGTSPGYIGYDATAGFAIIKRKPNSVLLFDEIEKSHPKVMDIFLQILDEGFVKDSKGNLISFKDAVIILTSNIGSREIFDFFNKKNLIVNNKDIIEINEKIKNILMKKLRPELVNRFDDVIIFKPLNWDSSRQILENLLSAKKKNIRREKNVFLFIEETAISFLHKKGFSLTFGAREMIRAIQHYLENPLVNFLIGNNVKIPAKVKVFSTDEISEISFEIMK